MDDRLRRFKGSIKELSDAIREIGEAGGGAWDTSEKAGDLVLNNSNDSRWWVNEGIKGDSFGFCNKADGVGNIKSSTII